MKNFLLILVLLSILSCSEKDPLLTTWKLVDIKIDHAFADYPKEERELMLKVYRQAFQGLIDKRKMTFEENFKFKVESPDANGKTIYEEGTWTKLGPNQIITTIEGLSDTLIIVEISKDKLILEDKRDLDEKRLVFLRD